MTMIINEFLISSNMAFAMYPGLTQGAIAALLHHATDEQKKTYLPKMTTGEWTGTMNLTEPHCGTDLGLLRSKAGRRPTQLQDHRHKIFISAASTTCPRTSSISCSRASKRAGGLKGISLFIVPKFMVNADGSVGARNALICGSIEHKMGIHGNSTCVMNYDGATGWLLGEANKGLNAMFTMMNEARLAVGMQGLSQSRSPTRMPRTYARERLQGRSISGVKAPTSRPIDHRASGHPPRLDVHEVLQRSRARVILWTALKGDVSVAPKTRRRARRPRTTWA